ncbi:FAD binding domain-containing protein [Phaeosphaeriaceae sp. PMI808]|nr:FAD binding domain-containing protein [Phaeosphaeriaceae sp. PMI808]
MANPPGTSESLPIIIVGAGICGLLLAQQFRKNNIPFEVYERDADLNTRGVGWSLTLHWSIPALHDLLPAELVARFPETFVDAAAVDRGEVSKFRYYDLTTGSNRPTLITNGDKHRKVTRERLRRLLATGIDIKWGKAFASFTEDGDSIVATFQDGSTCKGRLLVGCDGNNSKVRRAMAPQAHTNHALPIRILGFTLRVSLEAAAPIRQLDPFSVQGTASADNTFLYMSLLEAPQDPNNTKDGLVYQCVISYNTKTTDVGAKDTTTKEDLPGIIRGIVKTWAEPFRTFLGNISDDTPVKTLNLEDYPPIPNLNTTKRALLIGDAFHAMTMYRGEGANHAITDVYELKQKVLPYFFDADNNQAVELIRAFESGMYDRTLPAVLASRQACLDAHNWAGIHSDSKLLASRKQNL